MTKVQTNLLNKALKSNNHKLAVLLALHASIEYEKVVNLDNAFGKVSGSIDRAAWRSHLSVLAREGKYEAMQGEFNGFYGKVR